MKQFEEMDTFFRDNVFLLIDHYEEENLGIYFY